MRASTNSLTLWCERGKVRGRRFDAGIDPGRRGDKRLAAPLGRQGVMRLPHLRSMAEKASRGVVLRRRMPPEFGSRKIFVSPSCGLRYWLPNLGKVDPQLLRSAAEFVNPGDVVWDIGASLGLFTFAAAHRAGLHGSVLSVEPDIDTARLLAASARQRSRSSAEVTILPAAVTESDAGVAKFEIARRGRASNHLSGFGHSQSGGTREVRHVPCFTLDRLLEHFRAPSCVKIDVEGAEIAVLRGAHKLLSRVRPTFLIEVCGEQAESIWSVFDSYKYKVFDAALPTERRKELHRAPWDCVAIPQPS